MENDLSPETDGAAAEIDADALFQSLEADPFAGGPDMAAFEAIGDEFADFTTLLEIVQTEEFMVASAVGATIVLVDSFRRYNDLAYRGKQNDVVASVQPRFLATQADYLNSYAVYILLRLISYAAPAMAFLFVFMKGGVIEALGVPSFLDAIVTNYNFPLFWGAVIAGVLPSFSFIKDVEFSIRSFAQSVGAIPGGVNRMARRIRFATLRPANGDARALLKTDRFAFVDFDDFASTAAPIDRKWARLCYILDFFLESHAKVISGETISDNFVPDIQREEGRFRSLQIRYAIHKVGYDRVQAAFKDSHEGELPRTLRAQDPFLEQDIDYMLERLEVFLACALRFSENSDQKAAKRLRELGFNVAPPPSGDGAFGVFLATFAAICVGTFAASLLSDIGVKTLSTIGVISFPETVFAGAAGQEGLGGSTVQRAVALLSYTLMIVMAIILGGFTVGTILFRIERNEVDPRPLTDRPVLKYALASAFGAFCGLIALIALVLDPTRPAEVGHLRSLLYWTPSFFALAFMLHVFAYGPQKPLRGLILQSTIIGLVYGGVQFVCALQAFDATHDMPRAELEGTALYFASFSFWIGAIASGVFLYLHKSSREKRLRFEAEIQAAQAAFEAGETPAKDLAPA